VKNEHQLTDEAISIIYSVLPKELHDSGLQLVTLLIDVINGKASQTEAQRILSSNTHIHQAIERLIGKTITTKSAVITFEENSQTGDIAVRDIAGNNIINLHISLSDKSNLRIANRLSYVILLVVIIIAGVVVLQALLFPVNSDQSSNISIDRAIFTDNGELEVTINNKTENAIVIRQVSATVIEDTGNSVSPILQPSAVYDLELGGAGQGETRSIEISHLISGRNAESILINFHTKRVLRLRLVITYDGNKTTSIEGTTFFQRTWK
jgi:hypothetical protein